MLASRPPADSQSLFAPLIDTFGRVHRSLRISVTDRCNLRCLYCMPESADDFEEPASLLTFDEITRVTTLLVKLGIRKVRVTGGEPTLRRDLPRLIEQLAAIPDLDELALTTNGMRLDKLAAPLQQAGLKRVNISLDALTEEAFQRVTRRRGLDQVLRGIDAAIEAGFEQVRLNALAIRGLNEDQLIPLAEFALARGLTLRFIEYMPLGGDRTWQESQVLTGQQAREHLQSHFGPLHELPRQQASQPAIDYRLADHPGVIGFIDPVSRPFCDACDRLRLTAEGALRNCLFSHDEWSLKSLLREHADDADLISQIRICVQQKKAGHLITRPTFKQPDRPMYKIGG